MPTSPHMPGAPITSKPLRIRPSLKLTADQLSRRNLATTMLGCAVHVDNGPERQTEHTYRRLAALVLGAPDFRSLVAHRVPQTTHMI